MASEIKRGAIIGYVKMAATMAVGLIYTPIMLKMMGQSEYGLYSLIASVVAYLSVLDMGFGNAMIRFVSRNLAKKKDNKTINGVFLSIYSVIGIISLAAGIVLFFNVSNLFGATLSIEEIGKAKIILAIFVGTIAINFPLSIFDSYAIANEKFVFMRVLDVLKTIGIPLVMLPLLFMGYKSIAMVVVTCAFTVGYHFVAMYYCFKKLHMRIGFDRHNVEKTLLKEIIAYSFFIFLNLIVDAVFNNTDQIILGSVCGTIAVSIYAVAAQIIKINQTLSTTISGLFLPKVTKLLESDNAEKEINRLFLKVSRLQLYLMTLVLSGFLVFGKHFISIWAGPEYLDAYLITLIIIAPSIIPLTQNVCLAVIQAKGIHQFRSIVYIIIAVMNVAITIPLAQRYAGIGAAIGTCIANILGQCITMNIFYYKKAKLDIPGYWKFFVKLMLPTAILSTIGYFVTDMINPQKWITFVISVTIYALVYMVMVFVIMNKKEKRGILSIIKKVNVFKRGE